MNRFLQKLLPGKKLDEIHDLDGWRTYYIRMLVLLGAIAIPTGFLFSFPTYLAENQYGLIFFDLAIAALMIVVLLQGERAPLIRIFFVIIYGMTLTFLVTLGPYYARPAWLVMCVVSAAFLFGMRAAIIATLFNAAVLMLLYLTSSPYLPAWIIPHQDTFGKWLMFCVNLSLLSLLSGLPVGFLLNRMDSLLTKEQNLSRQLITESEDLQMINQKLEQEIAERVKAENENKRLQNELIQVQKMEAMGTLAGGIAHDFNNILSAIIGYGQLTQADPALTARARQNMDKLLQAGERARALVLQILAFSRKVETSVEPLDMVETVADALKMMRALIPSHVKLQKDLHGPCTVMSSSTFVHQILMNLCTNAIHAIGAEGGMLEIKLDCVTLGETEASELNLLTGGYARLTVSDNGSGIPAEIIDRIFEPYYTTKGMGAGTGLGLSVVHGIVKSHNGAICCHSVVGRGTTFEIYLPLLASSTSHKEITPEDSLPTGHETVLYIDDEEMLADTAEQILKGLGYTVIPQTDSTAALKLFSEQPDRFDAVITDMAMPHLTGDKLARKMLDIRPNLPIIICTGYSDYISNADIAHLGVRDFLMKPYSTNQLAHSLRSAIDRKQSFHYSDNPNIH